MLKATYTAVFHPEEKAGGYSVSFPALPGCYTQGDTLEEALTMAGDALGIYLYTLKEDNIPFSGRKQSGESPSGGKRFHNAHCVGRSRISAPHK